jgi:hypothetical protein
MARAIDVTARAPLHPDWLVPTVDVVSVLGNHLGV